MENLNKKDSILNATGKYEIQILFYLYQQFFDVVFMETDPDFLDRIRIFVRSGHGKKSLIRIRGKNQILELQRTIIFFTS